MVFGVDDLFAAYENIMDNKYPISITKFTIPEMINFQLSSVLTHFDHRFSKELCNFNTQDNIAVIWNSNGIEIINSYFFADQQMHYPNKIGKVFGRIHGIVKVQESNADHFFSLRQNRLRLILVYP